MSARVTAGGRANVRRAWFWVCAGIAWGGAMGWGSAGGDGAAVTNSVGMRLVLVPAGEFRMGSAAGEDGRHEDEMRHVVRLTRGFRIGAMEVTQRQWEAVMGVQSPGKVKGLDLPVTGVGWADAVRFCSKLSEKEGHRYRLPTEAEWEMACRAGSDGAFSGGAADEVAWHVGNSGEAPHPVGGLRPNAWGLHDMHGNAMEWCADWYAERLGREATVDPAGPAQGEARVARGGSFRHTARAARSAARQAITPSYQYDHVGFRVVMECE
ncbi:MAG TPA: SUMF1/EgtB/PvdO family nonheme iron enzyme [Verrucomicrobiae bacterium]|nr:SUMF1/EgtB/PvdO family nonheme iron enzyme [Verrucomicrobiae bacterium]